MFALENKNGICGEDADVTFQLAQHFKPELTEAKTRRPYSNNIEIHCYMC